MHHHGGQLHTHRHVKNDHTSQGGPRIDLTDPPIWIDQQSSGIIWRVLTIPRIPCPLQRGQERPSRCPTVTDGQMNEAEPALSTSGHRCLPNGRHRAVHLLYPERQPAISGYPTHRHDRGPSLPLEGIQQQPTSDRASPAHQADQHHDSDDRPPFPSSRMSPIQCHVKIV